MRRRVELQEAAALALQYRQQREQRDSQEEEQYRSIMLGHSY